MNETEKKLRAWFRRKAYSTGNTPTNNGFYLLSPVYNNAGTLYDAVDENGKHITYVNETYASIELDRFSCSYLHFTPYTRKHIWDKIKDPKQWNGERVVPSDKFTEWESGHSIVIPAEDIIKMAELIKASQEEYCRARDMKTSKIKLSPYAKLIGRTTSYEKIKKDYGQK
ncbi:hypothetical protein bpr_II060 (plasmid) [Butyrivibrio proteoclasticus B316]|uniref:Uncharacterized protein n=1 Tax=Butyrivibrio proteoclasticus (strain ATCC 51982 / DSM 14932 / B316) TaxID=515622 RepID=E0S3L8_BUTPB|nr:hypothetical protein [Butyrivibrio proteoclasticus]ADL36000.1 hypothetical protein bpr_II060 [Butyrivibrio proteoclasticus B316]